MSNRIPDGWQVLELANICYFQEGPGLRRWQYTDSGFPFINIRCIQDNRLDLSNVQYISADEANSKYKHFQLDAGDLVMSSSGTLGRMAVVRKSDLPIMLNTSVIRFRSTDEKRLSSSFLPQYLKSKDFLDQITEESQGSAQVNFGPTHLKLVVCTLPPIEEQQKIASILTAVDEVIESTQAQINKLKDLKTGMMQELLTKGIGRDGQPHTEFKDSPVGRIPRDWDIHTVGGLVDVVDPQPDHRTPAEVLVGVPYIGLGDIDKDGLINFAGARQVSKEVFEKQMKSFPIHKDAFIFGKIGTIGNPSILPTNRFYCLSANVILLTSSDSLLVRYLFQVFTSGIIDKQILLQTSTTSQPALGIKKVRDFVVPIPSDRQEIEKLVNLLAALDLRSSQVKNKLTHLISLKKSLMQDLLTGAVRVKT